MYVKQGKLIEKKFVPIHEIRVFIPA